MQARRIQIHVRRIYTYTSTTYTFLGESVLRTYSGDSPVSGEVWLVSQVKLEHLLRGCSLKWATPSGLKEQNFSFHSFANLSLITVTSNRKKGTPLKLCQYKACILWSFLQTQQTVLHRCPLIWHSLYKKWKCHSTFLQ